MGKVAKEVCGGCHDVVEECRCLCVGILLIQVADLWGWGDKVSG